MILLKLENSKSETFFWEQAKKPLVKSTQENVSPEKRPLEVASQKTEKFSPVIKALWKNTLQKKPVGKKPPNNYFS